MARHLVSSIPYLSNDGRESKYEPKDPEYRSVPIWMKEAEERNSRKKASGAKSESLKSNFFNPTATVSGTPQHLSKVSSSFLHECLTETPMFLSRKPKPANVLDPFASSFELV